MLHRYFGDVGDFGKYGLLRVLCGSDENIKLRLGVVWYLYPNQSHNEDGKYVHYLQGNGKKANSFRDCDYQLYDKLRTALFDDLGKIIEANRHLNFVEKSGLLPDGTVFYDQPLEYPKELSTTGRLTFRSEWFRAALETSKSADLVFLDPDNGIECKTHARTAKEGPKYVYWDDVDAFASRGQSLVIYHHLNRNGSHAEQVKEKLRQLTERLPEDFESYAITFKRGTCRTYLVVAAPQHRDILSQRLEKIQTGRWGHHRHFVLHR